MCLEEFTSVMQRHFLEKHGKIVFPDEVEYDIYAYEYTSSIITHVPYQPNIPKQIEMKTETETETPETSEQSDEKIHCSVHSGDYHLTIQLYSRSYLKRYIKANQHNNYVYIPLSIDSNGYTELGNAHIITKYIVIDLSCGKATLFDPMGDDTHMLYHSMYYRTNSIDKLLTSYFSDVKIRYNVSKSEHNLFKDSQRILSWCMWLVKTLLQDRNYSNDAYKVLLINVSKIPAHMKTYYIDRFANQYLVDSDEQVQSAIDAVADNSNETDDIPSHVKDEDQYDQLKAVLALSKKETDDE